MTQKKAARIIERLPHPYTTVALCPLPKQANRQEDHHNNYYDLNDTRERHFTASQTPPDCLTYFSVDQTELGRRVVPRREPRSMSRQSLIVVNAAYRLWGLAAELKRVQDS